jgi:hypothetical protein
MGDWRTIHLFDKTRYIKEVVPEVRNLEDYLSTFLNEGRSRWLRGFSKPPEDIILDTIKLVSELTEELSYHPELIRLSKLINKNYNNYYSHRENFIRQRQASIEFFEYLLLETIFSRVADFNPHFILGKTIFEGCVETTNNSIAEELTSKLTSQDENSILDLIDGGITNWLSKEEVELLHLDRDNVLPSNEEAVDYVAEFKELIKIAHDRSLGLISLRNPREVELTSLQNNKNEIVNIVRDSNFKYLIIRDQ